MNRFVLDASIALIWRFPDKDSADAQRVLDLLRQGATAIAPALWPGEVLNALLTAERRQRITPAISRAFRASLNQLAVQIDHTPGLATVGALAREHTLTAYDVMYLELAVRLALPLAAADRALARAAEAAGVERIASAIN